MERRNKPSVIELKLRNERSKDAALRMLRYIGKDKKRLAELMKCFLSDDPRLVEIAAWPLGDYFVENPEMLKPNYKILVEVLGQKGHHDAVYRCLLRAFMDADIPDKYEGKVIDICLSFITNTTLAVAIRAFSIKLAVNICRKYPEISNELKVILEELKKYPQTPAINSCLRYADKNLI